MYGIKINVHDFSNSKQCLLSIHKGWFYVLRRKSQPKSHNSNDKEKVVTRVLTSDKHLSRNKKYSVRIESALPPTSRNYLYYQLTLPQTSSSR